MEKIRLNDFLNYRFLSEIELSPDETHLAFLVHQCDEEENAYRSNLWVYDLARETQRELTTQGDAKHFLWLSEKTILFPAMRDKALKKRSEEGEEWTVFYAIELDGGEAREYMRIPLKVSGLRAVGDGTFVVLAARNNQYPPLYTLEGEEKAKLLARKKADADCHVVEEVPYWTNGGSYTSGIRSLLYRFDPASGAITPLSDPAANVRAFSVKDGKLLYISNKLVDLAVRHTDVFELDLATGENKRMLPEMTLNVAAADYIGGEVLCFGSTMEQYGAHQNPDLYRLTGGEPQLIAEYDDSLRAMLNTDCRYGGGNLGSNPLCRAFGDRLYLTIPIDQHVLVREVRADGSVENLTPPTGAVDSFAVGQEGLYYVGLRGQGLQEVYAFTGGKERRLTHLNDDCLRDKEISVPEPISFEHEGVRVDGYVMKPVGYEPGKKYPAVLEVHGGPKTTYGDLFYHEMQVIAAEGYFVFFCNPWGSEGRGREFADLNGKYGTIDYDHMMHFTDLVLERHPDIDRDRVGVTGGSYGGFMTNWIIGHTDRFRCAVSQRGICNWLTQFGCTDIGHSFVPDQIATDPWKDMDKIWFHSPMKYADQVKTPTLFIHSAQDYRCHMSESLQMFSSLKYFGVESRMCIFDGENHELSRSGKPKNRIRRLEEILGWFEKYLK